MSHFLMEAGYYKILYPKNPSWLLLLIILDPVVFKSQWHLWESAVPYRATGTAASPDMLAFVRNKQPSQAGKDGTWANFYWLPASLYFSISLGEFHSLLSYTTCGNPVLPLDVELHFRSKLKKWQSEMVVGKMVMQPSPWEPILLPGFLC